MQKKAMLILNNHFKPGVSLPRFRLQCHEPRYEIGHLINLPYLHICYSFFPYRIFIQESPISTLRIIDLKLC